MVCEEEMMKQMFPDLSVEEALQHQELLLESLSTNVNQAAISSYSNPSSSLTRHSFPETPRSSSCDYDPDLDEALARSLQFDIGDYYDVDPVSYFQEVHITPNSPCPTRHDVEGRSIQAAGGDDINPDEMTYEQLQSLGEAIGSESTGLSEDVIERLPSQKYKAGLFSKKTGSGECAICYTGYKKKEYVTPLPCAHQYHTECINPWLRENKSCPVCKKEVVLTEYHT